MIRNKNWRTLIKQLRELMLCEYEMMIKHQNILSDYNQ